MCRECRIIKEHIGQTDKLRPYVWDTQLILWKYSGIHNFHYRLKGHYHSDEVRSERFLFAIEFEDKSTHAQGIIHGLAVFFKNTEGYIEKLTADIYYPKQVTIKLIELDDEDIERIIPEVNVKFDQKAYMQDIIKEIELYKLHNNLLDNQLNNKAISNK